MSTINSTLSLAKQALLANQGAMATGSDNVANVNTTGYARRRVDLRPAPTERTQFGGLGTGVELYGVKGQRDRFVEHQLHRAVGDSAWFETGQRELEMIEGVLNEVGDSGLGTALSRFWNAWQDLTADPASTANRQALRETANGLVNRFRGINSKLEFKSEELNAQVAARTGRVNEIAAELARLNRDFARTRTPSPNLEDRRTQLLDELAGLINITYQTADDGTASVFVGGMALVMGNESQPLEVRRDDDGTARLFLDNGVELEVGGGEIGALVNVRDNDLEQLRSKLDRMAATLAREVNRVHRSGYGLDGSTGNDFFRPETSGMADIALSDEVLADLDKIAASAGGDPGDNATALEVAELAGKPLLDGATLDEAYQATAAWFGTRVADNDLQADGAKLSLQHMKAWRDAVSGVSLDEEMAELIRYQHSFNAAAKIVGAADTMLKTVIELAR